MNNSPRTQAGFTLIELMVSTAIIALIMLVLVSMTNQMSQTWRSSTQKIEKFQEARDGFESMTRKISQATLNTSWNYLDSTGAPRDSNVLSTAFAKFIPVYYGRMSDLWFVSGPMKAKLDTLGPVRPGHGVFFVAPFGNVLDSDVKAYGTMDNLLNVWGYFVEAGNDPTRPAFFNQPEVRNRVPVRWRSRLMEYTLPTEQMTLYDNAGYQYTWFTQHLNDTTARPVRVLAENILTLVIIPKLSKSDEDYRAKTYGSDAAMLSPQYIYDSNPAPPTVLNPGAVATSGSDSGMLNPKNQLPPILSVTMIAVDELSAKRLADKYCTNAENAAKNAGPGQQVSGTDSEMIMGLDKVAQGANVNYGELFQDQKIHPFDGPTGDLAQLENALIKEKVSYRIFTTNVSIRGAKWSRVQTK